MDMARLALRTRDPWRSIISPLKRHRKPGSTLGIKSEGMLFKRRPLPNIRENWPRRVELATENASAARAGSSAAASIAGTIAG